VAGNPAAYVLDSFALLAYLEGEAGMPRVRSVLGGAEARRYRVYLSLINLGEALYITERERGPIEARRALGAIDQLPLEIVDVSRSTVLAAAHIKAQFRISYADAFAVVAAQNHGGAVMTGDPEFRPLADAGLVAVEWLPRRRGRARGSRGGPPRQRVLQWPHTTLGPPRVAGAGGLGLLSTIGAGARIARWTDRSGIVSRS
jgi:predicted nucleic acid-binding protein